jgi:uracil-DNA glycosylase family 4
VQEHEHYCNDIEKYSLNKFLQLGTGKGRKVLIVGESPAPNGWRKSGRAFYTSNGKLLPTGKNLNKVLNKYDLGVENCGFTELVKCFVGKDRYLLNSCGEKCWDIFGKQLKTYNFEFLIILGVKTLELLNKYANTSLKIGVIEDAEINGHTYTFLPLYHPSPISPVGHKNNLEIFKTNNRNITQILANLA